MFLEILKYWVDFQRCESYLMRRSPFFILGFLPLYLPSLTSLDPILSVALVKTESRSSDQSRLTWRDKRWCWWLILMLIFFGFLRPNLSSWRYRNRCFVVVLTELESSDQGVSLAAGKNATADLVPCHAWKSVSTAISSCVDILEVSRCHLLLQMSPQWVSQISFQGSVSLELTAYLSAFYLFLDSLKWPYHQKHVNQINLNHTTL